MVSLASCSSTGKKPEDVSLDIDMKKLPAHSSPAMAAAEPGSKTPEIVLPADAKIDWQGFFKPAPTTKERNQLERKLAAWQEKSSASDLLQKGRNEIALGKISDAEVSFRQALRVDGKAGEALLELAQLYLRKRDTDRSFEYLSQFNDFLKNSLKPDPKVIFRYRYTLALAMIARGDVSSGHKVLSDLIALDKGFAPGYAALASSYFSLGKHEVAEFIAKRGLDRSTKDASLLNILGAIAQKKNERERALEYFNQALAVAPNYAPALVNRANLKIASQDYEAAEVDLQKAVATSPDSVSAYTSLGICFKKMGRLEAAKATFLKAVELDPENAAARFNWAVLLANDFKKPNEAVRIFHEVIQTNDNDPQIKNMARLYIDDIRETRQQ